MAAYTAINDPEAYFQVQLYTGDGAANNAITLDGDTDLQPDLVWIKNRDATDSHCLFDAVRGATKVLHPDLGVAEATDADTLDSFTSDGFQVDADVKVNTNAEKYVAWCWKETADAGFDIVTYEGNLTARTISHNLSAVPHCMIVKNIDTTGGTNWSMYHHSLGNTYGMVLSEAEDKDDQAHYWNDTTPTSSVFSLGDGPQTNGNADGASHVAYLWSEKQGFSKFGTYEGNYSTDGPFVYTGFRPAFIMLKHADGNDIWVMHDSKRPGYNSGNYFLRANANTAEDTSNAIWVDFLSNGFKILQTTSTLNTADTYIYMAFAEAPLVNSNGVPCNAR